ncbi:FadR/GntR family transcriptional regulator [Azoarcus sp. KH32C]|uniref:FadR/GntR family transcriptional regulator n=1 Tax=Azoarcus sp. KH32C TaxID=748247 RepID=UPI0002385CE7|nr:FadR/GntR family transcriptional regulator [Azoarcus sp. KH32C]BAL26957.1 transcriptional regulator, GntR family [Azoarcus sp. KH32C]
MDGNFPATRPGVRDAGGFATGSLASRVAERLLTKIREDDLPPGTRLPSEQAMAQHFGVSRTVIREAIAILKADGLLETRKGSGAFVCNADAAQTFGGDRLTDESIQALLNLIEVRRGVEAETAALAAVRRSPGQLAEIEYALRRIAEAVASGSDGVEEDARFHRTIAAATGNPYWVRFIEMFAQPIRSAVKVTRANEARREDFARQVMSEHEKIVAAIAASDPDAARAAAAEHMEHAAQRVRAADRDFWRGEGGQYARNLAEDSGPDGGRDAP